MYFFLCFIKARAAFFSPVFRVNKVIVFTYFFSALFPCALVQSAFADNVGAEHLNRSGLSKQGGLEKSSDTRGVMIAVIPSDVYLSESWRKRAAEICTSNSNGLLVCENLRVDELLLSQVKSETIGNESTNKPAEQSGENILTENRSVHLLWIFLISMIIGSAVSIYFAERNCPARKYLAEKYGNQIQR